MIEGGAIVKFAAEFSLIICSEYGIRILGSNDVRWNRRKSIRKIRALIVFLVVVTSAALWGKYLYLLCIYFVFLICRLVFENEEEVNYGCSVSKPLNTYSASEDGDDIEQLYADSKQTAPRRDYRQSQSAIRSPGPPLSGTMSTNLNNGKSVPQMTGPVITLAHPWPTSHPGMPTFSSAPSLTPQCMSASAPPGPVITSSSTPPGLAPSSSAPLRLVPSSFTPPRLAPSSSAPLRLAPSSSTPPRLAPYSSTPLRLAPSSSTPPRLAPSSSTPLRLAPSSSTPPRLAPSSSTPPRLVSTGPTPPGLVNLGNTCFINTVLQCLAGVTEFLQSGGPQGRDAAAVCSLQQVLLQCRNMTTQKPVDPTPLLQALSCVAEHLVKAPKGQQAQQDAAEFLMWLLDHVHTVLQEPCSGEHQLEHELLEELKIRREEFSTAKSASLPTYQGCLQAMANADWKLYMWRNGSVVYGHFLCQVVEARECQQCKKMSVNFEYLTCFPLPVVACTSTQPLESCLSMFVGEEALRDDNMLTCSCVLGTELTLVAGRRVSLIGHLSRNLILVLKRFSYDVNKGSITKNDAPISVPLLLDLQLYTLGEKLRATGNNCPLMYQLRGLCVHTGAQSTAHGHYIAYSYVTSSQYSTSSASSSAPSTFSPTPSAFSSTPSASSSSSAPQWYCFNDTNVTLIKDMNVELKTKRVLENAYVLFYSSV